MLRLALAQFIVVPAVEDIPFLAGGSFVGFIIRIPGNARLILYALGIDRLASADEIDRVAVAVVVELGAVIPIAILCALLQKQGWSDCQKLHQTVQHIR